MAEPQLTRAIGVWALAAGIVNVTIGGGIFRLPAVAAGLLGAAAPLAYFVCAVAMVLIVLCFADAGSRVSRTGGPYAYVATAFGPLVGFLAGVLLWVTGTLAFAAVSSVLVGNLTEILSGGAEATRLVPAIVLLAIFTVLTLVNVRGVRQGARLNTVATVAKLLPIAILVLVGMFAVRPENLAIPVAPSASAISGASIILIFAFMGIESALVPSGELRDPARTVPRAVFLAMGLVTLVYIAVQGVTQGILGPALADPANARAPLAAAAGQALGPWGRALLLGGATVSMFGYVSGMTLAIPRALFAFARDGYLPRGLAAVHPRFHTPHVAIVAQAALVYLLAVTAAFERLLILANLAGLLLYLACCLAAFELRRRDVREGGAVPFRMPGGAIVPWLAAAAIAFLLTSVGVRDWLAVGVLLALGAVDYAVVAARRGRAAATPAV